jgi:excisionase family DNA binding protein
MTKQIQHSNSPVPKADTADQIGATTHRIKSTRASDAPYMRPAEATKLLPVSRRTLSNWQRRHVIPFYRIGRTVMFKRTDIEAALEKFRVNAVGEV